MWSLYGWKNDYVLKKVIAVNKIYVNYLNRKMTFIWWKFKLFEFKKDWHILFKLK